MLSLHQTDQIINLKKNRGVKWVNVTAASPGFNPEMDLWNGLLWSAKYSQLIAVSMLVTKDTQISMTPRRKCFMNKNRNCNLHLNIFAGR